MKRLLTPVILTFLFSIAYVFPQTVISPWLTIKEYKPSQHLTFINKQLENIQIGLRDYRNNQIKGVKMVELLTRAFAGCRHFQALQSKAIVAGDSISNKSTLKLMQAHNIFESYVISKILELSGEKNEEFFARTLEKRLQEILPKLR